MNVFKIILFFFLGLLLIIHLVLMISHNTFLYKGIAATYLSGKSGPDIFDIKWFYTAQIASSNLPQPWEKSEQYNQYPLSDSIQQVLNLHKNHSFLVVHKGKLLFEEYFLNGHAEDRTNSFSMAKSILSMMVERAKMLGFVTSLDQPVADFLQNYQDEKRGHITFRHLLDMSSGLVWSESNHDPFSDNARAYYGNYLQTMVNEAIFNREAGKFFNYQSGSTQIAAMALEKSLPKSLYPNGLADFLSQEFWQPLGMKEAFWALDQEKGIEKSYCCIYARSQDFAKLGQLLLNRGIWNGQTILDLSYLQEIENPNTKIWDEERKKPNTRYSLGFWRTHYRGMEVLYFAGSLGQYIITVPDADLVIVRTGNKKLMPLVLPKKDEFDIHFYTDLGLQILQNSQ